MLVPRDLIAGRPLILAHPSMRETITERAALDRVHIEIEPEQTAGVFEVQERSEDDAIFAFSIPWPDVRVSVVGVVPAERPGARIALPVALDPADLVSTLTDVLDHASREIVARFEKELAA